MPREGAYEGPREGAYEGPRVLRVRTVPQDGAKVSSAGRPARVELTERLRNSRNALARPSLHDFIKQILIVNNYLR